MSQLFVVIQSLTLFEKFCLCALMIAINVSVVICQFSIRQFCSFGKRSVKYHSSIPENESVFKEVIL